MAFPNPQLNLKYCLRSCFHKNHRSRFQRQDLSQDFKKAHPKQLCAKISARPDLHNMYSASLNRYTKVLHEFYNILCLGRSWFVREIFGYSPISQNWKFSLETVAHGFSQQGVWVPLWTPKPLKRTPQDTHIFCEEFLKKLNLKLIIEFFYFLLIPMTLFNDIMPYFNEFIHVYGWNMSILWSPSKVWTPKIF